MHTITAFERRENLNGNDLARLRRALTDEVERYRDSIRGYDAEKMQRYGEPYLAKLEARVAEVDRLMAGRLQD